jgi:hypothetical protein
VLMPQPGQRRSPLGDDRYNRCDRSEVQRARSRHEIPGLGRIRRSRRFAEPDHRPGRHAVTKHASDARNRGLRAAVFLRAGFGEKEETTDSGRASPLR